MKLKKNRFLVYICLLLTAVLIINLPLTAWGYSGISKAYKQTISDYYIKLTKTNFVYKIYYPIIINKKPIPNNNGTNEIPEDKNNQSNDNQQENLAGLTAEEQQMINLINKERTSRGLAPLVVDMRLVKTARMKSQDMINKNYFSHQSPTYGSPFDLMRSQGITYRIAGENLAGAPSVEIAHRNLMNSPGHRANILNPNFTHVGVGIISGGPYGKMFTQHFIGK
ncbi:MAG: SCP-like extracellular [Clostridia bacterium 41_269]|nr:MAG: SCP-like extracellular [Clostridia bacterium 41_269]